MSAADRAALVEFQQKVARLQRAVQGALDAANALKPRLALIRRALLDTPAVGDKLLDDAAALDKRTNDILRALRGDSALRARNINLPPSIQRTRWRHCRLATFVDRSSDADANQSIQRGRSQEFEQTLAQLRQLIEGDLARLEKQMEAAGAPVDAGTDSGMEGSVATSLRECRWRRISLSGGCAVAMCGKAWPYVDDV